MDITLILLIVFLLLAIVVALVSWLGTRKELSVLKQRFQQAEQVVLGLQQDKLQFQKEKDELLGRATAAEGSNLFLQKEYEHYRRLQELYREEQTQSAVLQTKFDVMQDRLVEQKQQMESMSEQFRFEFNNLAQSILEEKTAKFTDLNEEKMKAILGPLKIELVNFKQKVEETYDKESKERFTLGREVQRLVEMSQQVSQEANNLAAALKSNNKQQGNWGEMILESILDHSGLTRGREYFVQEFIRDNAGNIIKDEQGKALQPDVTILYPDQRKIIIDSKVSLVAWERYVSEENADIRKTLLKEHVQSIRSHLEGLSRKNYPFYASALDYVLMFIPVEPAFLEAVKTDLQLWKYAYDKRIMLVSATNLLAVLKIISDLWRVEQQNRHAIEIADKAGSLYDKFAGFIENLEQVGRKLQDAQQCYDVAFRQLSTGRGNIVNKIDELKKMGANATKQIPGRLVSGLKDGE